MFADLNEPEKMFQEVRREGFRCEASGHSEGLVGDLRPRRRPVHLADRPTSPARGRAFCGVRPSRLGEQPVQRLRSASRALLRVPSDVPPHHARRRVLPGLGSQPPFCGGSQHSLYRETGEPNPPDPKWRSHRAPHVRKPRNGGQSGRRSSVQLNRHRRLSGCGRGHTISATGQASADSWRQSQPPDEYAGLQLVGFQPRYQTSIGFGSSSAGLC